ncbi:MAG: UDP-N-acetylmuramoyl-L-alanine--D-glutamate ligase [Kiritimatiellae bacterium]|nr:UDP-N-acetylmuramoyl-L-alanine--D-glutamate ligase [Kiritimatiellia bacterium]
MTRNREMDVSQKSVLVLGLGASGVAASRLLLKAGAKVTAIDTADNETVRPVARELHEHGVETITGATGLPPGRFDLCVTSPGIPSDSTWFRELRRRDVPVISELELGAQFCRCPLLAVTGTNGKSTTVKLCGDILQRAGRRVECAGNYGPPLSLVAERSPHLDWLVVEVSSFQLEWVRSFKPSIAVLLNVAPNHLDRHPDMETYLRLKLRLFSNMSTEGTRIVSENLLDKAHRQCGRDGLWITFGTSAEANYSYKAGMVVVKDLRGTHSRVSLRGTIFANEVTGLNACAAVAATASCGVDLRVIESAIRSFVPLRHRLEPVGEKNGVRFVNDSKATNLTALAAAVSICGTGVRLIAGGLLKERDCSVVKEILAKNVRAVYLMGACAEQLAHAWKDVVSCRLCGTLEKALEQAWKEAQSGEIILLSPGCASFDQFRNFEERGDLFRELAQRMCRE